MCSSWLPWVCIQLNKHHLHADDFFGNAFNPSVAYHYPTTYVLAQTNGKGLFQDRDEKLVQMHLTVATEAGCERGIIEQIHQLEHFPPWHVKSLSSNVNVWMWGLHSRKKIKKDHLCSEVSGILLQKEPHCSAAFYTLFSIVSHNHVLRNNPLL